MKKVALTGGIATGKSYVLSQLRKQGVPCLDADALAHGVLGAGTEATQQVAARFGAGILAPDGSVDRGRLGAIVFADPSALRDLEAIVHPAVYRTVTAGLRAFERIGNDPVAVVDVPLLYETGHAPDFDRVIVTMCAPAVQLTRLRQRGISEAEAQQRMAAQWPSGDKAAHADFVIRTDGTYAETDAQISNILKILTSSNS